MNKWERKLWFQKNKGKLIKRGTIILSVLLLVVGVIYITYSKFESTQEFTIINGKVVQSGDVKIISYEYDGTKHDAPPSKDSGYGLVDYECSNGAKVVWDSELWGPTVYNLTDITKCKLYFGKTFATKISSLAGNGQVITDITEDRNIRYVGSNPNNYITFEGELWRIIGVFNNVKSSEISPRESRVKIIRASSLGNMVWGSTTSNDWSKSQLQTKLNGTTYNYATSSLVDNTVYYLGGRSDADATSSTFYLNERSSNVYSNNPILWVGKVALMYPSDYGFSNSNENCRNTITLNLLNDNSCGNGSYLYTSNNYQWTLTPRSNANNFVFITIGNGNVHIGEGHRGAWDSVPTFPVVYLKSNVVYQSGTGTSTDPYVVSE